MNTNKRVFFSSFLGTLCVLSLIIGVLVADYESRKIGFNDHNTLIDQIASALPDGGEFINRLLIFYLPPPSTCFIPHGLL